MRTTIEHILVPTDFSEASEAALATALDLARAFGARVTLLHAWSIPPFAYAEAISWPLTDFQGAAREALDGVLARTSKTYPKIGAVLREGGAWEQIVDVVKTRECDLVVMGTHGRHGLPRVVLGSVAAKVVRLSPVPVVTVAARQAPRQAGAAEGAAKSKSFARILVPTDFSEASERSIAHAVSLARTFQAQLTLVHVWRMPNTGYSEQLEWPNEAMERAARKALGDALARTQKLYGDTDAVLREGAEAQQILELVDKRNIDLVVMGTHGRRGISRLVLGSIAEKIVRLSPVPVFTVGIRGDEPRNERQP